MDVNIIIGRGIATGTNTYLVTLSVDVNELKEGNIIYITFTNGNTAASSLNPNGIGVIDITDQFGEPLTGGEIPDGGKLQLEYNLAGNELRIVSNASTGNIKTVKSILKTDTQTITTSAPTWTDVTGLTLTMIPSKASDSFLVQGYINVGVNFTEAAMMRILRIVDPSGAPVETPIGVGDALGSRTRATSNPYSDSDSELDNNGWCIPDSPNSADDILYKVQLTKAGFNGTDIFVNRGFDNVNASTRAVTGSGLTVWQLN